LIVDMIAARDRITGRLAGRDADSFAKDQESMEIVAWTFIQLGRTIDASVMWDTAQLDLPALRASLATLRGTLV
jgi:hypothetical protein